MRVCYTGKRAGNIHTLGTAKAGNTRTLEMEKVWESVAGNIRAAVGSGQV